MFDLGSVDGGMLSLVYRPLPWLRVYGGGGSNSAAPGLRLGAAVSPFLHLRELAFNLDGGHFFPGDINGLVRVLSTGGYTRDPRLEHFDYDFASLHLGWETQCAGVLFFVRGGASVLWTEIPATTTTNPERHWGNSAPEPFWLLLPSLRIGFIGFL